MFASKDIQIGDEITFCYGESTAIAVMPLTVTSGQAVGSHQADVILRSHQRRPCHCGSKNCQAYLPGN